MTHYPMGDDDFDQEDSAGGVCLTPDCVKVAANILTSADLNADPCEDFYQGLLVEANDMGHIWRRIVIALLPRAEPHFLLRLLLGCTRSQGKGARGEEWKVKFI